LKNKNAVEKTGCWSKIPFLSGDAEWTMQDTGYRIEDAGCREALSFSIDNHQSTIINPGARNPLK